MASCDNSENGALQMAAQKREHSMDFTRGRKGWQDVTVGEIMVNGKNRQGLAQNEPTS